MARPKRPPRLADRLNLTRATTRRAFVVIPLAALLLVAVSAVTLAGLFRYDRAELALRFMSRDAGANARFAASLLETNGSKAEARSRAQLSLARSPISPIALRVLGFLDEAAGQPVRARALLTASAAQSRRDTATQLWLIEDAVHRNDVPGALDHFDVAMRVSTLSRSILFPILGAALADPEFIPPITQVIARRPNWALDFLVTTLQKGIATENIGVLLSRLRVVSDNGDRQLAAVFVTQATNERRWGAAQRFLDTGFARANGSPGRSSTVSPGRFDEPGLTPFAWTLASASGLSAEVRDGNLEVYAGGTAGTVAARTIMLPPGTFVVALRGSLASAGRLTATLRCAPDGPILVEGILNSETRFSVPAFCPAQSLTIDATPRDLGGDLSGTLTALTIRRDPTQG